MNLTQLAHHWATYCLLESHNNRKILFSYLDTTSSCFHCEMVSVYPRTVLGMGEKQRFCVWEIRKVSWNHKHHSDNGSLSPSHWEWAVCTALGQVCGNVTDTIVFYKHLDFIPNYIFLDNFLLSFFIVNMLMYFFSSCIHTHICTFIYFKD